MEARLQPMPPDLPETPGCEVLLLYASPDLLIEAAAESGSPNTLTAQGMVEGYLQLLEWSERTGQPLLSLVDLRRLGATGLARWLSDGDPAIDASDTLPPTAEMSSLLASVTLSLLEAEPQLLDRYLDVELRAVLMNREPDVNYHPRLRQTGHQGEALLQEVIFTLGRKKQATSLLRCLAERDGELAEVEAASELSRLRVQNLEEELFRQRQACEDLVSNHQRELETRRQCFEARQAELAQCLAHREMELQEMAKEENLTQLRLQHVQQELEHSFLADGENQRQFQALTMRLDSQRQAWEAQRREHQKVVEALNQQRQTLQVEFGQLLAERERELRDAKEEVALTVLQRQRVQEELEIYFLKDQAAAQLLQAQTDQILRALHILARLHPDCNPATPVPSALAVEVCTVGTPLPSEASLQMEALLSTYAATLERARGLLERMKGS